jgi:hypothetical protein
MIWTTQNVVVEELVVSGEAIAAIDWTYGIRATYSANKRVLFDIDLNKRTDYSFGYRVRAPVDKPPFTSTVKLGDIGGSEWTATLSGNYEVPLSHGVHGSVLLGTGISKVFRYSAAAYQSPVPDFGPGLESTTEVFRIMDELPLHPTWVGIAGFGLRYRRFVLQTRYLKTLSRSVTRPFVYEGQSYPWLNKRDGVQLTLGYRIPIGTRAPSPTP